MKIKEKTYLLFLLLTLLYSCEKEAELTTFVNKEDIEETIGSYLEEHKDQYSIFYQIAEEAEILEPLKLYNFYGNKEYTLFLPDNSAFDAYLTKFGYQSVDELLQDSSATRSLARMHIVASSFSTNEFPLGRLPDSTFTGEYLFIGFDENFNYKVNNSIDIVESDIENSNGMIHVINGVLYPIQYTSYQYLVENERFSLIKEVFDLTGLSDTMGIYRTTFSRDTIRNYYTLMLETNEVFERFGINNINDLIFLYANGETDYTNRNNGLYQFAAYHILEGYYAINMFLGDDQYVTYADFPMSIDARQDIIINKGIPVYDTILISGDLVPRNYIRVDLYNSNIFSKNGPIHTLKDLMVIKESIGTYTFSFENEPVIFENLGDEKVSPLEFSDTSEMINISWKGIESIYYLAGINGPNKGDCLYANGNFTLEYRTPNISSGTFDIILRLNRSSQAPMIKLFVDGVQQKSMVDLSIGNRGYSQVNFGSRTFTEFGPHNIRIETVIGGEFYWDYIKFETE